MTPDQLNALRVALAILAKRDVTDDDRAQAAEALESIQNHQGAID